MINIGIAARIGKIIELNAHPRFAELHSGSARIAVTDRGSITVPDQQYIEVY